MVRLKERIAKMFLCLMAIPILIFAIILILIICLFLPLIAIIAPNCITFGSKDKKKDNED